jgi:hypothetical protein
MMTTTTYELSSVPRERRRYQQEVERLLEQIAGQVGRLHRLRVGGVNGRALADRKRELRRTRERLAALTSAPSTNARA